MTARELIARLSELPPDTPVVVRVRNEWTCLLEWAAAELRVARMFKSSGGYGQFRAPKLDDRNNVTVAVIG